MSMRLQERLTIIVAVFGLIAVIATNVFIYGSLKIKDENEIKRDARNMASLVRYILLNTMIRTNDYDEIDRVIGELQEQHVFEFRMVSSGHVIKQYGMRRDKTSKDYLEKRALESGEVIETMDTPSLMRIIYPFITDKRCGKCHEDMNGEPVKEGIVNGLAVIRFDLSQRQQETRAAILKQLLFMSLLTIIFFICFIAVVNRIAVRPIQTITEAITGLKNEQYDVDLPAYHVREFAVMAQDVRETASQLAEMKNKRKAEREAERTRAAEIEKLVRSRASTLGFKMDTDLPGLIDRMSVAVDEVKKNRLLAVAFQYVDEDKSRLVIPTDPNIVPAISAYLTRLIEAKLDAAKLGSIELAIDEALSNAIYHGNLEIPSDVKSDDFDGFYELANERRKEEPYASRTVEVRHELDRSELKVTVTDEGPGFDWRTILATPMDAEKPHGRGLMIIRALASRLEFNDKGNQVTLTFEIENFVAKT